MEDEYDKKIEERKSALQEVVKAKPNNNSNDNERHRFLHIQQDLWSSRTNVGYLGISMSQIKIDSCGDWRIIVTPVSCTEVTSLIHSAANIKTEILNKLAEFNVEQKDIGSSTQDTAANSIQVFNLTDVWKFKCFAHLANLMIKGGFAGNTDLDDCVIAMSKVASMFNRSNKRKILLQTACERAGIKQKMPVTDCITRWNFKEFLVRRFFELLPAYLLINTEDMFGKDKTSKNEWDSLLRSAKRRKTLLSHILPFLKRVAEWTQILSGNQIATVCYIRFACKSIMKELDKLSAKATKCRNSNDSNHRMFGTNLGLAVQHFKDSFKRYFGEYQDNWQFIVAEALNPRTCKRMCVDDQVKAFKLIVNKLCTKQEKTIPTSSQATAIGGVQAAFGGVPATEENANAPINVEIILYSKIIAGSNEDVFIFWRKNQDKLPIMSKYARYILPINACSADAERLFSAAGIICSPRRNKLSPSHLNMITCLRFWYENEFDRYGPSAKKPTITTCSLSSELEIEGNLYENVLSDAGSTTTSELYEEEAFAWEEVNANAVNNADERYSPAYDDGFGTIDNTSSGDSNNLCTRAFVNSDDEDDEEVDGQDIGDEDEDMNFDEDDDEKEVDGNGKRDEDEDMNFDEDDEEVDGHDIGDKDEDMNFDDDEVDGHGVGDKDEDMDRAVDIISNEEEVDDNTRNNILAGSEDIASTTDAAEVHNNSKNENNQVNNSNETCATECDGGKGQASSSINISGGAELSQNSKRARGAKRNSSDESVDCACGCMEKGIRSDMRKCKKCFNSNSLVLSSCYCKYKCPHCAGKKAKS